MSFKFLRFGIEAEFLLTTRSGKGYGGDLEAFAQYVCSMYQTRKEGGWPNMHVDLEGYSPGDNDNMEWSLTDDDSVAVTHDKQYPLELVSPVLHFESNYHFRDFVDGAWKVVQAVCLVETNTWCGTHVHVSPDNNYTTDQVKSVARAALYFESALNALVPPDRLKSRFCKSFHASNPKFKGKAMDACIALVDAIKDTVAVIELMNPDRCFVWNFQNLWYGRPLTIEFRQGPGVTSSADALAWAEFAVTFVGAAIKAAGSYKDLQKYPINVGGLKTFLKNGVVPGVSDAATLARVTGRAKSDSAKVDGTLPGPLDKEGEKRFEKKVRDEERKHIFMKKMEKDEKKRLAALATGEGDEAAVEVLGSEGEPNQVNAE